MVLVTSPLMGKNFNCWSRLIVIILGAKSILDFIYSKCVKPDDDSNDLEQWMRVHYVVASWILNFIAE